MSFLGVLDDRSSFGSADGSFGGDSFSLFGFYVDGGGTTVNVVDGNLDGNERFAMDFLSRFELFMFE